MFVDRQVFALLCVLQFVLAASPAFSAEPVRASIEKESAWTGEAVPLIITLYSPGPFQGTASFDFPELSQTAILSMGNPVVASEELDGESLLTQRHEFTIYTQRSGQLVVPSFQVRFQGKQSFVGDAVAMQGLTPELTFLSKRPPGTENLGVVVAASNLKTEQSWTPAEVSAVQAGDVIERTISRRVAGTTAMMLPPVVATAPDGVRVYPTDPVVEDKITRGQLDAMRIETIKYQFQRSGRYDLPDVVFTWWDPRAAELQSATLEGQTIDVNAVAGETEVPSPEANRAEGLPRVGVIWIVTMTVAALALVLVVRQLATTWRSMRNTREAVAARTVDSACRSNDARAAYAAILDYRQIMASGHASTTPDERFEHEWNRLTDFLYAGTGDPEGWTGDSLRFAFAVQRQQRATRHGNQRPAPLPALNPRD